LNNNLDQLYSFRIKICTKIDKINLWYSYWEEVIDLSLRNFITSTLVLLEDCPNYAERSYYHYIQHQDFELSISENISDSSLALAANMILSKQITAILNIPGSSYCQRPHIPILKSSYESLEEDILVNIPCFEDANRIIQYFFLNRKIKPLIEDEGDFKRFCIEYYTFINRFDFENWRPKVFISDHVLSPAHSFPASGVELINRYISHWRANPAGYLTNVASYRVLGGTVLELHGYTKNNQLSVYYNQDIFEAGRGNSKLLISLDTENGAFEVIDYTGTHIGVYGYDGRYIRHYTGQIDINSHSLINLPHSKFIFN
jgi:hypothetical protein